MNSRDRILAICEKHNLIPEATVGLAEEIIAIIKEELIPKDQTYQEFFSLDKKPELIQGYTAENWQEIIDGGYLCEFRDNREGGWHIDTLRVFESGSAEPFESSNFSDWHYCRPAQIKGVVRPIFVEPVDEDVFCHFFSGSGSLLFSGKWAEIGTTDEVRKQVKLLNGATKYIEL